MGTQARRSGTRRKRTTDSAGTTAAETTIAPAPVVAPPPPAEAAELLDEQTAPISGGGAGLRIGRSLVGAVAGTLLIAGLAFGAALGPGGSLGPKLDAGGAGNGSALADAGAELESAHDDNDEYEDKEPVDATPDESKSPDAGDEVGDGEPDATDKPVVAPTEKPAQPDPTKKPVQPDPTKKPEPQPDPTKPPFDGLSLSVWIKEFHPVMEWGSCEALDFDYYKVVRSTDSTVTWPKGENDELIGAVEAGGYRKAWDSGAPHGKKVWYRVFCVRHTDAGYKVLAASNVKGIEVPDEPAVPDPISLDLQASINEEGKVVLSWSACNVDGFGFYKVLRSTWTESPSYLPWHDGTEVIGVVESKYATEWHDGGGDPGQTVYYRVQCLGYIGGSKVLLGQTAVVAVTMP